MKKIFIILLILSLITGIERNSLGQCNTITITNNLMISKPSYYYFGQVWHGELFINNQTLINAGWGGANINYTLRHSENGNFCDLGTNSGETNLTYYEAIVNQLNYTGTDPNKKPSSWNSTNNQSFWNLRMSALSGSGGLIGKYILIGFKNINTGAYLFGKIQWKELPPNFNNGDDRMLSDRLAIFTAGIPTKDKAHIIINTQNFGGCSSIPNINNSATPNTSIPVSQKVNHFFYKGFANNTTNVTMQYLNCAGTGANSVGQQRSLIIVKSNTTVPAITATTTEGVCDANGRKKVTVALSGGTGVYEMWQPDEKTYINGTGYDKYTVFDDVFGRKDLYLLPGTTQIRVRDARNYDQFTGDGDPVSGQDAMFTLLPQVHSSGLPYYNVTIPAVGSCNATPTITTNASNPVNFSSVSGNQTIAVTGTNLTGSWSATSNSSWLTISGSGQNGISNLTLIVSANTATTSRSGTVTISGGGATAVTISVLQAGAVISSPCYRFNIANYASSTPPDLRPITLSGSVLNLNSVGDNTNNSIWKIVPDGTNSKIVSVTNENTAITIEGSNTLNSIVNVANYTGAGNQKWLINQDAYGNSYIRSSLDNSLFIGGGNGAYGGGDTDPNTKDLKLKNDLNWGANKWKMVSVTCPAQTCDFNLANNTQAGQVGANLTLNPNCTGTDCNLITYSWSGNGQSGNGGLNITLPNTAGTYTYTVVASKSGCTNKTSTINVTVTASGTCNPVTSITSGGTYKFKVVSTGQFIRPNSTISNKLEVNNTDNTNTFRLDTDGSGYKMTSISTGKIVEIQNGSTGAGGVAVLAASNPSSISDHQRFQFELVNGNFKIKPASVATWNWGLQMETYSGSGEYGLIRQYGYDNPLGNYQVFNVCQISGSSRIATSEFNQSESEEKEGIFIAPNPVVNNMLHYSYVSDVETDEVQLQIFDMTGRSIKSLKQQKTGRETKGEISVEGFMQGSYILNATDGVKKAAKRFLKE